MSNVTDVLHVSKLYKDIRKAIDHITYEKEKDFLHIMLGRIDYKDGRRRVLTPREFMDTYTYTSYRKYIKKYDDEFLSKFGIQL